MKNSLADEPAAQALRHGLPLRIVDLGIGEVAAHQLATDPVFEAANTKDVLPGQTVPRLAAATPCLLPHLRLHIVVFAGHERAEAAVGAGAGADGRVHSSSPKPLRTEQCVLPLVIVHCAEYSLQPSATDPGF